MMSTPKSKSGTDATRELVVEGEQQQQQEEEEEEEDQSSSYSPVQPRYHDWVTTSSQNITHTLRRNKIRDTLIRVLLLCWILLVLTLLILTLVLLHTPFPIKLAILIGTLCILRLTWTCWELVCLRRQERIF